MPGITIHPNSPSLPDTLTATELRDIRSSRNPIPLHTSLLGSRISLPVPLTPGPPSVPNPRLQARLARLRAEQEEREYCRMTRDVNSARRANASLGGDSGLGMQIRAMNRQIVAVLQFVVSVAAAFCFGFYGSRLTWGDELDIGVRLLLGVICGLVVGLAELYFLAVHLAEDDDSDLDTRGGRRDGQKEHEE